MIVELIDERERKLVVVSGGKACVQIQIEQDGDGSYIDLSHDEVNDLINSLSQFLI